MRDGDPETLSWSGMVDAIGKNKYDMGLTGFSQDYDRFKKVKQMCNSFW
jgi:hypothetical protein